LAKDEIERMVDDARTHESEDQQRRAEVETRNQADALVFSTEKMLEEHADKVPEDLKAEVEAKVATLKAAMAANNLAEIQPAVADLNTAVQRLGQAVYSQAGDPAQPGADPFGGATFDDGGEGGPAGGDPTGGEPGEGGPSNDQEGGDTVEGEFREV
jgi:molecular chaperone DnaK